MSDFTSSSPDDRWHRLQTALRLAGLGAVLIGLVEIPPGIGTSGRPLAVAIFAAVASVAWLVLVRPPRSRRAVLAALIVLIVCGGVVTGLTPGGPAVALPAVAVFEAIVRLTPLAAARLTLAGVAAMAAAAVVAGGTWGATVAGYGFALAAALLLGVNRRQYLARTQQAQQLLEESQRARQEQARAAALDERARIAREIHDLLAHSLGALAVQLEVAEALLADGTDPHQVQTQLQRARGLALEGLSEARRAVAALRGDIPPLPQLLDALLQQYRADGGVAAPLQVRGVEHSLTPDAALAALRTAQEAISNARKHAAGAPLCVGLTYADDVTVLTVTDTPPPIPQKRAAGSTPSAADLAASGAGYGLTGLRERAEMLGGSLQAGPDGEGWTVRLRLPTHAHAAA
jgi:signal transduction histidine kinase